MSQQRKSTRKKRQTQLSFTPLPSSSPAASQYPEQIASRAAAVRYGESPTKKQRLVDLQSSNMFSSPNSSPLKSALGKQKVQVVIRSPTKGPSQLPTPAPSSQVNQVIDQSGGEAPHNGRLKGLATGANDGAPILSAATATYEADDIEGTTSEDDVTPFRSSRRARAKPITLSSDEDSESWTPTKRVQPKRGVRIGSKTPSDSHATLTVPMTTPKTQSDGDASAPRTLRTNGREIEATVPKANDALVISSGAEVSSSEDEVVTPARRRRIIVSSGNPATNSNVPAENSSDDLDDEVADLDDNELRASRTRGRQDNSERSKRQRRLEELRQRRVGIEADNGAESGGNSLDNASESEPGSISYAMRRNDNLDEYEDDFLDDEDDALGVDLGVAGVPLQFTYHANKKPFEHFKTEVEWMVHNKLNPAFDRHDEIYILSHRKLNMEVQALGSSKFSSSVWKEKFTEALNSRPELFRIDIPTMLEHKCDACQRSNHPPKHQLILKGKPYNRDTLETIEKDDDEDDEDDSDEQGEGGNSGAGTDEEENFFLGRFCCANAEMAHALRHWRYHLNDTVLQWLASEGHLTPEKIVARDKKRQKEREKEANKVVDGMEETGVMRELYHQFKQNLEAARDSKPKHFANRH